MFVIRATSHHKEDLPEMMASAIKQRLEYGTLDGLVHVKDDPIHKISYGWEMLSYWGTPDEANPQDGASLAEAVKEKLYSSEDLRELVSIIWDVFIENYSNIDLFREDVLNALQGPDTIRGLLCVLNSWLDKLDE